MTRTIDLGFVALTDAAPLIVGVERGFFESAGLRVQLHREVSWATIRDKLAAGVFQGAHMLAPMALATSIGAGTERAHIVAPMALNAHGASVGVSAALAQEMDAAVGADAAARLASVIAARRQAGAAPLAFAVVFPFSMHNYMLRYWLAGAGIDPDRDVRIVIAPPTAVAVRLQAGDVDGFAVGAPWGAMCVRNSAARLVLESAAFWNNGPDKVLALSGPWAEREQATARALIQATLQAARWADAADANALAALLSAHIEAPADIIARHLGEAPNALRFGRAAFPWRSQAAWQLSQMLRWGQIDANADLETALGVYRPDLFRQAAEHLGLSAPDDDVKIEQGFGDGSRFAPDQLRRYAAGFAIPARET